MTLHWWMHWFWITCQFTCCILLTHSMPLTPAITEPSISNRPLRRPVKSIDQIPITKSQVSITIPFPDTSDTSDISVDLSESLTQLYKTKTTVNPENIICLNNGSTVVVKNSTSGLKNINETYFLCNKKNTSDDNINATTPIENLVEDTEFSENTTTNSSFTSIIANNTLSSVIVTKELVSAKVANTDNISSDSSLTAVSITGISFGVLIFAAFVGVTSFVLYRRRYLNKPQTLNDKCSNPDSSGYIDDSTMRENSEEMYSLDNDSFLNSLEAMTIQNYWTDNVKHTKL